MIFAFITFPFFFGLMFGDVGHGIILLCVGIFLWHSQKYKKKENNIKYASSWVLIFSALFSIYAGLIYNEIFSRPFLALFTSNKIYDTSKSSNFVFGISPKWTISSNKMLFINSFKMKLSIILAYFHQSLGLILSVENHL